MNGKESPLQIIMVTNKNFERRLESNKEYVRIFVNTTNSISRNSIGNELKTKTLTLSKNTGDSLFLISNIDYENFKDYFRKDVTENVTAKVIQPIKTKNELPEVKKPKQQQSLQGFFKSK